MAAIRAMHDRVPLVMSGDLHAVAAGRMLRSGDSISSQSDHTVLTGPIGTRPADRVAFGTARHRRAAARPPRHGRAGEANRAARLHHRRFAPDKIEVRMFKWDGKTQKVDEIDTLEPFHTVELIRPA